MFHWATCELEARIIVSNVSGRNFFLHLGEALVSNIRDDSLDKLPFVLQRSLQARMGCLRVVLGHRG
jgi:hypothetical protein